MFSSNQDLKAGSVFVHFFVVCEDAHILILKFVHLVVEKLTHLLPDPVGWVSWLSLLKWKNLFHWKKVPHLAEGSHKSLSYNFHCTSSIWELNDCILLVFSPCTISIKLAMFNTS